MRESVHIYTYKESEHSICIRYTRTGWGMCIWYTVYIIYIKRKIIYTYIYIYIFVCQSRGKRSVCNTEIWKLFSYGAEPKVSHCIGSFHAACPSILLIVKTRPNVVWNTESRRWSFFRSLFLRAVRARETHVWRISLTTLSEILYWSRGATKRCSRVPWRMIVGDQISRRTRECSDRLLLIVRRVCRRTLLADGFPRWRVSRGATGRSNALDRVDKLSMLYCKLSSLFFVGYFTHANVKIDEFRIISRRLDTWTSDRQRDNLDVRLGSSAADFPSQLSGYSRVAELACSAFDVSPMTYVN